MLSCIPSDILVKVLHVLEIEDILLVESTCRSLRQCIMLDVRHLWLTKLNELDPSCAPDMPHDVPVESLTCEELRNIVIKAVRQYWALMKPSPSKPIFSLRNRIPLNCPEMHHDSDLRSTFIPGGRYLFIFLSSSPRSSPSFSQDLYIVDTKDSNRRVWSYVHGDASAGKPLLHTFEFKARRDGTIIVVVLYSVLRWSVTFGNFFQILKLSLESESGTFRETPVFSMPCSDPPSTHLVAQTPYPVSDDLVVFLDSRTNVIFSLRWDEKKVAMIQITRFDALCCFRIWRDHLFYIDIERQELRAVPLSQLLDLPANEDSMVELDHISCPTLNIHELRDQNGNQPVANSIRGTICSIYDTPWKKDSTAVFTITLQSSTGHLFFTTIRARFSSDDAVNWRWTVLSVRATASNHLSTSNTLILPDMTRSGRILLSVFDEYPKLKFGICAADRQGNPIIAFQPMEIDQLLQGRDNNPGRSREALGRLALMGLSLGRALRWTRKSSDRTNESLLRASFDEYSGSLSMCDDVLWHGKVIHPVVKDVLLYVALKLSCHRANPMTFPIPIPRASYSVQEPQPSDLRR